MSKYNNIIMYGLHDARRDANLSARACDMHANCGSVISTITELFAVKGSGLHASLNY